MTIALASDTATERALTALARLSTSSGHGQPECVRAVEVFGRPPTGIAVPLNRKTTQQAILTLTLEGLEPRQELVPVQGLESYIVKPRRDPADVARVQMRDGRERLLIQEGHTRLGAAVLRGDTEMPVRVWEFVQTDTGGFAPVVRGRQRIYERIRDRKATGPYRSRVQTLAASFGIAFDLYGTEKSGNRGHSGRPGQIGGSGPGGMPSPATVNSWGHAKGTLTATGDETSEGTPQPGKPFIVYRLGKAGEPLDNRNAGNADGVAHHISRMQDPDGPKWAGGSGDTVTAYEVTIDDDFTDYERLVGGKGLDRKDEAAVTTVGRKAEPYHYEPYGPEHPEGRKLRGLPPLTAAEVAAHWKEQERLKRETPKGGMVIYSFPKGATFTAKPVATIPLADLDAAVLAHYKAHNATAQPGNKIYDFSDAGAISGATIIRKAFAQKQTTKLSFDLYGTASSGNRGHAGRPGQVGGSAPAEGGGTDWGGSGVTGGHEHSEEHADTSSAGMHHAIEHEQYRLLKERWADLNVELFKHMDNPDSPEYIAIMEKQQAITKEKAKLNLDNGHITEGIKMPGGPRDVVVIGAGPGGLNAAINGGTEGLDTLLIDANMRVGGQLAATSRIENFGGYPAGVTGKKLGSDMLEQVKRVGAEAMLGVRVTHITHDEKTGLKTVHLNNGETVEARTVVLAPGITAIRPKVPGADASNVLVQDNVGMEAHVANGGHAIVVGGANSAAQAAMGALKAGATQVTILARSGTDKMSETVLDTVKSYVRKGQIRIITDDQITEIHKDANGRATGVTLKNGEPLTADTIGFFIGGDPATKWLKDTPVKMTKDGLIKTDRNLETNMPGVFAVGDARAGSEDLDTIGRAGSAHGQGQEAIRNVFKYVARVQKAARVSKETAAQIATIKKSDLKERDRLAAIVKSKRSSDAPRYPRTRT